MESEVTAQECGNASSVSQKSITFKTDTFVRPSTNDSKIEVVTASDSMASQCEISSPRLWMRS